MTQVELGLMLIIALLSLIIMVLVWIIVKRPKQIVYVERPRNTSIHEKPVNVDAEFERLIRKVIQRSGYTRDFRFMYLVALAASNTDEPVPVEHWLVGEEIHFNFTQEIARLKALEWAQNIIIRDHTALWLNQGEK